MKKDPSLTQYSPVILGFLIPALYWAYLFFTSSMDIKFDSIGYEKLGKTIFEHGWASYFITGPNREPLYPFFISCAMHLEKIFSAPYQKILTVFQIACLVVTQALSLRILGILRVKPAARALCVLYIGLSPAIVNSAFCLFSEIIVYPLILYMLLLCHQTITQLHQRNRMISLYWGISSGLAFVLLTSVKGVFEFITPLLLGYLFIFLISAKYPARPKYSNIAIFMAAAVLTFYVPLHLYKSLNYKYNHQYALTDRGGWMLYGTAAKRTDPKAIAKLPAAFAYNLGDNVCPRFFPKEDCDYWPFATSDDFGMGKMFELSAQGLSSEQVNKKLFSLSKDLILAHPLQYFLVMGVESIKFVFWESTKMGCVNYPPALADLFDNHMFKDPVRLIVSLLTLIAVIYIFVYLIRSRKEIFDLKDPRNPAVFIALISYFLLIFAGFHCLFSVITRYMLPIAPLYLILIAFTFSTLSSKQK